VKRNYKTLVHLGRSAKRAKRHEYHRHVFPRTEVKDVRARIARLQRTLGRFADVQVRGYADNIFEIRAPGADDRR
jgi:hypothetical protein